MVTKKRQINYEVLRLIACFAVVLGHVAAEYYYVLDHQTFSWKVLQWFLTITLFHVPTFFMLNGCFLFKREPTAEFIRKNVGRLLCCYFGQSYMLHYVFRPPFFGLELVINL